MARRIALWVFGILASGVFGGLIGNFLAPDNYGGFWGLLGGSFAFVCARLWFGEKTRKEPLDTVPHDSTVESEKIDEHDPVFINDEQHPVFINDEQQVDAEVRKVFQVQCTCQIARMSIEGFEDENNEMRQYERDRFEKLKQKAIEITNGIEDVFLQGAALHHLVSLCLAAHQTDEAENFMKRIQDDFIRKKASAEFDSEKTRRAAH